MTAPLLKTKLFFPPLHPNHISRPRLIEQLNKEFQVNGAFTRKLTLISAPAGFGKTTLAINWLQNIEAEVRWYSLGKNDNDPVRFLTYLVEALKPLQSNIGSASLAMLQNPKLPPPENLLSPLVNDISLLDFPFILVLDDYHLVQNPVIHQQINFLVDYQPVQMHLAILTREDPPIPLHKLRAQGQMLEIRQAEIQFTLDESTAFLRRVVGKDISPETVSLINQRTEGWVTGMQLLALSLQKHPDPHNFLQNFNESNRFILDYLFEEAFQQQSYKIQDFLLKTSILDQLTPPLCEAVSGNKESKDILNILFQANLFIVPLDPSHSWYRYHRLFLELLRHRLRMQKAVIGQNLHKNASQWYEANGYMDEAIHHALDGIDFDRACALIQQVSDALLKGGAISTLIGWFRRIPSKVIRAHPECCLTYSWALLLTGLIDEADLYLRHAEKIAKNHPRLLGEVAAAQAFQAQTQSDDQRLIERSELALSLLPKNDLSARSIISLNLGIAYWHDGNMEQADRVLNEALPSARKTGNKYVEITTQFFLGRIKAVHGQLRHSASVFKKIIQSNVQIPVIALAYVDLGALYYEWNDLNLSLKYIKQGLQKLEPGGNPEFQVAAYMFLARLKIAQNDKKGALNALEAGQKIIQDNKIPARTNSRWAAWNVEYNLSVDDLGLADQWAPQATAKLDAHPFYRFSFLTPIRMLMAKDQMQAATNLLKKAYETARKSGWKYSMILLRIYQSLGALQTESALVYLTEALTMAQPEAFIRTFADAGKSLLPLLREAARNGVFPEYVGKIMAAIESIPERGQTGISERIEQLSERELEVLRLLAAGLSNRQIAGQLFVSISTIKSHVHHICTKLGAQNRTQSVAHARQLGLL